MVSWLGFERDLTIEKTTLYYLSYPARRTPGDGIAVREACLMVHSLAN
jgi:hypothetical protein